MAACWLTKMDDRKEEERVTEESSGDGPSQFCFCKGKAGGVGTSRYIWGRGAQPQVQKWTSLKNN